MYGKEKKIHFLSFCCEWLPQNSFSLFLEQQQQQRRIVVFPFANSPGALLTDNRKVFHSGFYFRIVFHLPWAFFEYSVDDIFPGKERKEEDASAVWPGPFDPTTPVVYNL